MKPSMHNWTTIMNLEHWELQILWSTTCGMNGKWPNILCMHWNNVVKANGTCKCCSCMDGSKCTAPWLCQFVQTYASCIEQPCMISSLLWLQPWVSLFPLPIPRMPTNSLHLPPNKVTLRLMMITDPGITYILAWTSIPKTTWSLSTKHFKVTRRQAFSGRRWLSVFSRARNSDSRLQLMSATYTVGLLMEKPSLSANKWMILPLPPSLTPLLTS